MTAYEVFLRVFAVIGFAGVCCRLYGLDHDAISFRMRMQCHGWILANVLIGLGLLARLFGMETQAVMLISAGLALYYGVRWHRRGDE